MMTKKKQIAWVLVMALFTACSSTPKQTETETVAPQWPYPIDLSEVEFSHEPQCLSEFADSIEYIQLSDSVLLPDMFHLRWLLDKDDYIYIFEFKLDGTAEEALAQIEEKGYARPYEADSRKLFKVGTVFSSETGTISDFKMK